VLRAGAGAGQADPSTNAVVSSKVHDQAATLLVLGELDTAQAFLAKVTELTPARAAATVSPTRAQSQPAGNDGRRR
jgi:hypothetical protein